MPFVHLYVDLLHRNLVGFIAHINFQLLAPPKCPWIYIMTYEIVTVMLT